VLTVENKDFPRGNGDVYGSAIQATGSARGFYLIQVSNPLLRGRNVNHRRFFLYKPSVALIVVDDVKATRPRQFRRWFHLGPDIQLARQRDAFNIAGPGFVGRLQDSDRTGRDKTYFASTSPFQGYTFPKFRVSIPRQSVLLQSKRLEEATEVAAFSLGSGRTFTAADAGGKGLVIELNQTGKKTRYLQILRKGADLSLSKVPRPSQPRTDQPPDRGGNRPGRNSR
jgi:hypothetical protein